MTTFKYLIDVGELKHGLSLPDWRVVDCRFDLMRPAKGHEEYLHGHIPGASYANLDTDLAGPVGETTGRHPLPSVDLFSDTLSAWGIDNESQVVVYDYASGAIAARLWWMLKWVGHERVAVLNGGFEAWQNTGYEVSEQVEPVAASKFRAKPNPELIIATGEVGEAPLVIDARERVRFEGKREPIDAVAGHIPGAVNHPFSESMNPEGGWKSRDELREDWQRVLGAEANLSWVAMCGSGVTACHLALSAALAGYRLPLLYVGSWSEWIRDSGRPVATDAE